jgi:hypothetical protein
MARRMLALGMVLLCACALYVMPATALGLREAIEKGGELTAELTKVA